MAWDQPMGVNVAPVQAAITALAAGTGDYEALKAAVSGATFAVRPQAHNLSELGANWDYETMPETFTDTVQSALFAKIITREQYTELAGFAQFAEPVDVNTPGGAS